MRVSFFPFTACILLQIEAVDLVISVIAAAEVSSRHGTVQWPAAAEISQNTSDQSCLSSTTVHLHPITMSYLTSARVNKSATHLYAVRDTSTMSG